MAPSLYSDIGKKTGDLLYKDYSTSAGTRKNESIFGELHTQLKNKNLTIHMQANSESDLLTTVTIDEFGTPELKSILSLVVPDQRSGKLELQYLHEYAGINASIGLNSNCMVNLSGVFESKELSVRVDVSFDTATSSFTKYNAALSLSLFTNLFQYTFIDMFVAMFSVFLQYVLYMLIYVLPRML